MEAIFLKITKDVYSLNSTKGNYAYLIWDNVEGILIDTGRPGQGNGILNELNSMNIKPVQIKNILITHHDVDHVGNLAKLEKETRAKIWASKDDIPYIYGDKSRHGIKKYVSILLRAKKPQMILPYPEDQKIGDIEIIPTPGHTPGHVCLLYNNVLFAGDLLRTSNGKIVPMRSFMNWDDSLQRESINKISNYDFDWICPAHGDPIKRNGLLEELIKDTGN
jgi:glyoxylase-like metal-dependent hydrolase (beta-lactamase superfamily II)